MAILVSSDHPSWNSTPLGYHPHLSSKHARTIATYLLLPNFPHFSLSQLVHQCSFRRSVSPQMVQLPYNWHLDLPQTMSSCHTASHTYMSDINPAFHLQWKLFLIKFLVFSEFYPPYLVLVWYQGWGAGLLRTLGVGVGFFYPFPTPEIQLSYLLRCAPKLGALGVGRHTSDSLSLDGVAVPQPPVATCRPNHRFSKCSVRSPRALRAIRLLMFLFLEIYCGAP